MSNVTFFFLIQNQTPLFNKLITAISHHCNSTYVRVARKNIRNFVHQLFLLFFLGNIYCNVSKKITKKSDWDLICKQSRCDVSQTFPIHSKHNIKLLYTCLQCPLVQCPM